MKRAGTGDVVLIDTGYDGHSRFAVDVRSQPNLGLAYIAASLEEQSFSTKIIDRIVDPINPEEIGRLVSQYKPMVVGITTSTLDRFMAIRILKAIKTRHKNVLTVGGGPHFSATAIDALKNIDALDVVCFGEGEYSLCEIVERFKNTRDPHQLGEIDGIAYRKEDGSIALTDMRAPIGDLDKLPFPAWHLFDMKKYQGTLATMPNSSYRAIGIGASRGCPYSCAFCCNSQSKKVRRLSASRFVDMIEQLGRDYQFEAFNFVDDSFTHNVRKVEEICQEIINRELNIKWYCSLNINQAAKNIEMLEQMKSAGCVALGFGLEFPDNEVLKAIHKKSTTELIEKALINVRKVGFSHVQIFLLQGLPKQNIINTLKAGLRTVYYRALLEDQNRYFGGFVQVYPGTEFEKHLKEAGRLKNDFSWNTLYSSNTAGQFRNAPNQRRKLPTVPIYQPETISLETVLTINKIMKRVSLVAYPVFKTYLSWRQQLPF